MSFLDYSDIYHANGEPWDYEKHVGEFYWNLLLLVMMINIPYEAGVLVNG